MDIGIDIGGTFTDVVCRSSDGKYTIMKDNVMKSTSRYLGILILLNSFL